MTSARQSLTEAVGSLPEATNPLALSLNENPFPPLPMKNPPLKPFACKAEPSMPLPMKALTMGMYPNRLVPSRGLSSR